MQKQLSLSTTSGICPKKLAAPQSKADSEQAVLQPEISSLVSDNRLFVNFTILDETYEALLDPGAHISVLGAGHHNYFIQLGFELRKETSSVLLADLSPITSIGTMSLPIACNNINKTLTFLVCPDIHHKILCGMDFTEKFGMIDIFKFGKFLRRGRSNEHNTTVHTEFCEIQALIPRDNLTRDQTASLEKVIKNFESISSEKVGLGKTHLVTHSIVTKGDPIKQRYYPLSPAKLAALNKEVDEMLKLGVIAPSRSPWSNPVVMTPKKDGSWRFCLDARKLNDVTVKDSYPLPYINSILDNLRGVHYLTSIDLSSSFWQILLSDKDGTDGKGNSCEKTAFVVPNRGLFEFKRMPFGLSNAGAELQRLIDSLFQHKYDGKVFCYLDDLLIGTPTFTEHISILSDVCKALKEAGLTVNLKKCDFCKEELKYLGYIINSEGLRTDPEKLSCIENFPQPKTAKQLRGFIGLCSYYRRFVKDFSSIIAPMTALVGKRKGSQSIEWSEAAEESFKTLKRALITAPLLASPDFTQPFTIECDASSVGIGSVLLQEIEGIQHPVAFHSRLLTKPERNYSTTERELLAVVDSINHFRAYIEGSKFTVITDHMSLRWLKSLSNPSGRLARWAMQISSYNFDICHKPGKLNVVPDALSRVSINAISYDGGIQSSNDQWYNKVYTGCQDTPLLYRNFQIKNNRLYRFCKSNQELSGNSWKLVLPRDLIETCIKENHDSFCSVHPGTLKTYLKIKEHYYWKDMFSDVKKFVSKCEKCKAYKHSTSPPHGLMTNQKQVDTPLHTLSLDIIGPLPKAYSGHVYILSVVDVFSKYVWLHPLRTATTQTVTSFLEKEIILKWGTPAILICDNATTFKSAAFKAFCNKYSVPKIFYNAYYTPQSNTVERYNKTIEICLSILVDQDQRNWSKHLQHIQLSLNSTVNLATGYTPYLLATGREIITDGTFHSIMRDIPSSVDDITIGDRNKAATALNELAEIFIKVEEALTQAYQKNAQRYNLRRRHFRAKEGDIVWRRNFVQSNAAQFFSAKLAPKFVKCKVEKKLSDVVYELRELNTGAIGKYHAKDILRVD